MVESRYEVQYLTIHGHRRAFVKTGQGPVVLLLHGLGCDHTTWESVIDSLARRYTVIAPDLLGHGLSDKPRADYSVGGYANGMRDLLTCLGHRPGDRGRPQLRRRRRDAVRLPVPRADRAADPGRLGRPRSRGEPADPRDHHAGLPPGDGRAHAARRTPRRQGRPAGSAPSCPSRHTRDLDEVAEIYDSFKDPAARHAIRHVVRAVVDWRGQIVTMADRAYLTQVMPMAVIWGRDDQVIPVSHASHAARLAPDARVEVIPNAGHFPHKDHPQRFAKIVHEFIRSTQPATYSRARFRALLRAGRPDRAGRDGHQHHARLNGSVGGHAQRGAHRGGVRIAEDGVGAGTQPHPPDPPAGGADRRALVRRRSRRCASCARTTVRDHQAVATGRDAVAADRDRPPGTDRPLQPRQRAWREPRRSCRGPRTDDAGSSAGTVVW